MSSSNLFSKRFTFLADFDGIVLLLDVWFAMYVHFELYLNVMGIIIKIKKLSKKRLLLQYIFIDEFAI